MKAQRRSKSPTINYSMADPSALSEVKQLLSANGLPQQDIERHSEHLVVAKFEGAVIGSAGIEYYGREGLLRSVCVDERFRNQGIAAHLCDLVEAHARNIGIAELCLLTTSAQLFFMRRGFKACPRDRAPSVIRNTEEFKSLCPATATVMCYSLGSGALHLPAAVLPLRDDVPGARMWAAGLKSTMLTYFEVDPHTRFEMHKHAGEQITSVIEGELCFVIDDRIITLKKGDAMAVPPGVPHAVFTGAAGAKAFDAWSPPPPRYR